MSVDMKVKAIYDSEISNITRSEKNWKDVLKVSLLFCIVCIIVLQNFI